LENANNPPFEKKKLPNQWLQQLNILQLPEVKAITINEITTAASRIEQYQKKYAPVIESMEGAALHFVCREMNVPFIQIRSISNYVGERDKNKWLLKESIANLNKTLLLMIDKLYKVN
jgi:futalosine hydrolase